MDVQHWNAVLARVTGHDAADIDEITRDFDPRAERAGRDIFPEIPAQLMPEAAMKRPGAICVGLRVEALPDDPADQAMRLVAFALEKDVEIVVLSHVDHCGFERFGFRTERIAGATEAERAACEDQLRRFWNIDTVL
jgi:hypothetical protein